ncbi:MAG: cytochrome c biogenesis factor, partial [bacterium]|nr:cytochrome c biogenesis factor [bacterium]
ADYVRLSWSDAVLQSEMEVASDQIWRIAKMQRKPSSCPILFAWDGERFAFITDFLGVGGVGFFTAPGVYGPPDPTEDIRIPPELIAPREGRYHLRITEPLEEVTYMDELHLVVHDHPKEWEIHPDERFSGVEPLPTGEPFAVAKKIFPQAARDHRGEDVLDRLLRVDRRYVEPPKDPRFTGFAKDHWVELDFGDLLGELAPDAPLVLYLYGWVEYTYSHVNYAAHQAGITMRSPWIEVPDGEGGWRVALPEAGFPAGLPRMMTLDISTLPLRKEGRIRIRSNMEVFWDQIFVGENVLDARLRTTTLLPVTADLRSVGYPREFSPDGSDPTLYDYHRVDMGVPFKNTSGEFTRFGDVRELLDEVDDRFVIMARGEEIALEFDASSLPTLPPGWTRTIVLHSDGYCKDMDLYTAYPDTVEPLPFHGMKNYPPGERTTSSATLEQYRRSWNTRRIIENEVK